MHHTTYPTHTTMDEQTLWDVGGQWIGPQQTRMHALLKDYGIGTKAQHDDTQGKLVIINEGALALLCTHA